MGQKAYPAGLSGMLFSRGLNENLPQPDWFYHQTMPSPPFLADARLRATRSRRALHLMLAILLTVTGCSRFHPKIASESVYVMAKQTFLRDRVAAVSNRVGTVQNGQKLVVLEHARRFLKVRTEKGEIGWIEERAVVAPAIVTGFQELAHQHGSDTVVATAVLRDDLYMHLKPGRDTERFYLLPKNDKLQLLVRSSVPKVRPPQAQPPATHSTLKSEPPKNKAASVKGNSPNAAPPADSPGPPAMEDWWLTRDSQGRVGWLLARRMDVDVPDSIGGYAEGQRMVGAYILTKVSDPDSSLPGNQVPVYVSVLSPFTDGLPYDFDQVRVFTWNLKKHRYETAYRQRNLQGYLPVVVKVQTLDKQGPVPTFEFQQGVGDGVITDPQTGAIKAAQSETVTYRLDGVIVKKVAAPAQAGNSPSPHSAPTAQRARSRIRPRHQPGLPLRKARKAGPRHRH
jgi:Bacterial SH3 domain